MSNFKLSNLGHQISAVIGSVLFARTTSAARIRTGAVFALMGGVFMLSSMGAAEASSDLNSYARNVSTRTNAIPDVITYVSYIAGAGLSAVGIVDLKKHVENPSQTPMKNGLAKLGFGGMLLALPMLAGVAQGTVEGGNQVQYQNWSSKPTVN